MRNIGWFSYIIILLVIALAIPDVLHAERCKELFTYDCNISYGGTKAGAYAIDLDGDGCWESIVEMDCFGNAWMYSTICGGGGWGNALVGTGSAGTGRHWDTPYLSQDTAEATVMVLHWVEPNNDPVSDIIYERVAPSEYAWRVEPYDDDLD